MCCRSQTRVCVYSLQGESKTQAETRVEQQKKHINHIKY